MLPRPLADRQILQLGRASPADWDAQLRGGLLGPNLFRRGSDLRKGNFHAAGIAAALAYGLDEPNRLFLGRRSFQYQFRSRFRGPQQKQFRALGSNSHGALSQLIRNK